MLAGETKSHGAEMRTIFILALAIAGTGDAPAGPYFKEPNPNSILVYKPASKKDIQEICRKNPFDFHCGNSNG
jgi:hypothetical protein